MEDHAWTISFDRLCQVSNQGRVSVLSVKETYFKNSSYDTCPGSNQRRAKRLTSLKELSKYSFVTLYKPEPVFSSVNSAVFLCRMIWSERLLFLLYSWSSKKTVMLETLIRSIYTCNKKMSPTPTPIFCTESIKGTQITSGSNNEHIKQNIQLVKKYIIQPISLQS